MKAKELIISRAEDLIYAEDRLSEAIDLLEVLRTSLYLAGREKDLIFSESFFDGLSLLARNIQKEILDVLDIIAGSRKKAFYAASGTDAEGPSEREADLRA